MQQSCVRWLIWCCLFPAVMLKCRYTLLKERNREKGGFFYMDAHMSKTDKELAVELAGC